MLFKLDKDVLAKKKKSIKTKDKIAFHSYLAEILNVENASKVLDLGCGHGNTLIYLSKMMNSRGKIIGVDKDEKLLAVAEHLLKSEISKKRIELIQLDLDKKMTFEKNSFDRIVCHNVLECIDDKISFINQCFDLLKKGGLLVMSHSDWDSQIYNSSNNEVSRRLLHNYSDTTQSWMKNSDGTIGRKLRGIFYKTKFKKIEAKIYTTVDYSFNDNDYSFRIAKDIIDIAESSCKFSRKEIEDWFKDLQLKNKNKDFYYSNLTNIIVAKK